MPNVPARFLLRIAHPCTYLKDMPRAAGDDLLDLPEKCRIESFGRIDGAKVFADVRLGWNELGIGAQVSISNKSQRPQGSAERVRSSDGTAIWIDTRDSRTSHRASRYCHQFYLLPTGGGPEGDEPALVQTKIHRALQDAPIADPNQIPFRVSFQKRGYTMEAFFPASVLQGFDPDQNPKLGFYFVVRDLELGEQALSVGSEFPYWEDPSLWSVLVLAKPESKARTKALAKESFDG